LKTNNAKKKLKEGNPIIGTMTLEFTSAEMGRALAAAGFDFVIIDTEHSSYTLETVTSLIRAAKSMDLACVVRVPDPLYHLMARTCDAGAQGLMVPRVETREQVESVIRAVKYPPLGKRGYGIRPIHTDYQRMVLPELLGRMNDESMIIIQIESRKAVENIDDLLSVGNVDVALVGPYDLSIDLGLPGEFDHPAMLDAIENVIAGCSRHGVAAGIHLGDVQSLVGWHRKGMRCLTFSSDLAMLLSAATKNVNQLREEIS
jgi:2-keto-3-deoxy-L-rhamnonate aldolase RhmA